MNFSNQTISRRLAASASACSAALLVLALLLYLKPYTGIRHDSVLYLGQALLRWKPEQFGNDLFFLYGSQAQFTLFPQVLASLLNHFNAADLFIALTLLGRILFVTASHILVRQIFSGHFRLWALLSLLIMPSAYGGYGVFSYGEHFATGRTFAEPLVLIAMAAFLRQRWTMALIAWMFAAAIHPLQALPALLLLWAWMLLSDRRWLHLLWLPAVGVLLGLMGVLPFSSFLSTFDPQWMEWTQEANKQVYVSLWPARDWCYLVTDIFFIWLLCKNSQGILRKLGKALLLATAIGLASSAILADLLRMVWLTGLQIWRIHWLLHWMAMASIPFLLYQFYLHGKEERPRLLMLITIAVLGVATGPVLQPWVILGLIPLFLLWPKIRNTVGTGIVRLLMASLVLVLLVAYAKYVYVAIGRFALYGSEWGKFRIDLTLFIFPLMSGALVAAGLWCWHRGNRVVRASLMCVLIGWTAYAASYWDYRNDWTRAFESASPTSSVFGTELRAGAQVYWEKELLAPWLILGRTSYFSDEQTSGLLFNRKTAEEAQTRRGVLLALEAQTQICDVMNTLNRSNESCAIDDDAVQEACHTSQGRLDYVVLRNKLKSDALGRWTPIIHDGERPVTYYLYQCKNFSPKQKRSSKHPSNP